MTMKKILITIGLTCSSFMLPTNTPQEKAATSHRRKHYLFCSASLVAGAIGTRLPYTTPQQIDIMRTYFLGTMTGQTVASMAYNGPPKKEDLLQENQESSNKKHYLDIAYGVYNAAFIDIARRFRLTTPKHVNRFRTYALGCIASQAVGIIVKEIGFQQYANIQQIVRKNNGPNIFTLSATTELY